MSAHLTRDPVEVAAEQGQQVVLPGPYDVFVDIDTDEAYACCLAQLGRCRGMDLHWEILSAKASKSGLPHRHVYLRTNRELSPTKRITLQACFGSDPTRELLSLMRIWLRSERPPTTFFEDPAWVDPRLETP